MSRSERRTSVVVPVYNDPKGLETTVRSLLDQSAENYEVVVVDNGSTDRTSRLAEQFAKNDTVVHVVEREIRGSYAARNAGIEVAQGDVIGFVDADMWVDRDYVASITRAMRSDDRTYMGCDVEIVADETSTARFNAATGFPIRDYIENSRFAPTCCLVVESDLFEAVGTFDHRVISGGDKEFGQRVTNAGYELTFEPGIVLYHPARGTIRSLVAKHVRIGRGIEQLHRYYPDRLARRSPLHPKNFLPGRPSEFSESLNTDPVSTTELVYWYLLRWLLTVSETAGRIVERVTAYP